MANTISGSGSVNKAGNSTLVLTANNSYEGDTVIDAGTLQVGNGGTTGSLGHGAVINRGELAFNHGDAAGPITVANAISGSGSVSKAGASTLVLTGANTYTGGTTIANGTLQVGAGGASGNLGAGTVSNAGSLVFNRSGNVTVTNIIEGSGSLTQRGPGRLELTGTNTYTGGTTIAAGTLAIDNNQALGEGRVILGGGTLLGLGPTSGLPSDPTNLANSVLVPDGTTGTIVAASGTKLVLNGVLAAAGNNAAIVFGEAGNTGTIKVGTGFVNPESSGSFDTLRVAGGTLADDIGALLYATAVAGTTTVDANARLQYDLGGVVRNLQGAGTVASVDGLMLGGGNFSGPIEGGPLAVDRAFMDGTGSLILSGNNSYAGGTSIASGNTLQVGAGGDTGTLGSGDVLNNGALVFKRSNEYTVGNAISGPGSLTHAGSGPLTLAGAISGSGSLTQSGSGTLVLTGNNSYSGTTTIATGTLQVGAGGDTGSLGTGGVTIANGGVLALNRGGTPLTVAGTISGGGALVQAGPGTTILTGESSYTGGTTISAGTLQIGDGGTSGTLAAGSVINNGTLAFNRSGMLTVANAIDGAGVLVQAGPGTTVLTGESSYTGGTTIAAGTLQIGDGGTSGSLAAGGVTIDNGGTLAFNRSGMLTVANAIDGAGALVQAGPGTTVLTGESSYTGGTTISAGTLQIGNGGTSGTLAAGSVINNGTLAFNRSDAVTAANTITGTGGLIKTGGETLVLTGDNTYEGPTTIAAGTLQVGTGGTSGSLGKGSVTNDGTLAFNRSGMLTVAGAIGGAGKLVQDGPGTTILTGDSSYTGGTTIAAGTLQIGDGGTSGTLAAGGVTIANNGTLAFNRSDTLTVAGAIGGAGKLVQAGPGTTILTGDSTYTGGTTISAGTLQIGNGGTSGNLAEGSVTNHGTLAFNRSDAVTVANTITGTGGLTQAGPGTLLLTGANTYSGPTLVNSGTLAVNGSITGPTTVNSGGTLGGSGTVGSVSIAPGGTLAPGNSIGTLTARGNLSFAPGSIYRVEANASGAADRVNTVGAGTITISGGTVDVQAGGAGYQRNTRYTILDAAGGVTGSFTDVTTNLAFLTPTLIYEGNAVQLNLQANGALAYDSVARTPNQRAVAHHVGSFSDAPSNEMAAALIQQIDNFSADEARQAFGALAGTPHASASQVALAQGRNFSASLAKRTDFSLAGPASSQAAGAQFASPRLASLDLARFEPPLVLSDVQVAQAGSARGVETPLASADQRGLWVQALGAGGRIEGDANANGWRYRSNGFVLGYEQPVGSRWLAGAALGYSRSDWHATSGEPASGDIDSPQAGLYARYAGDAWRLRLDATYADHDFSTERTISFAQSRSTADSSHRGQEWGLGAQVEAVVPMGEWQLRPLAGLRYAHLVEDAFTETGAGAASLAVAERTTHNTLISYGLRFVRLFNEGRGGLELRAIASHLAGDKDSPITASLAGQPGSFTAHGAPLKRDALTLGTTLSGQFTRSASGYLDLNYEYRGSGQNAYQATAGVKVSF